MEFRRVLFRSQVAGLKIRDFTFHTLAGLDAGLALLESDQDEDTIVEPVLADTPGMEDGTSHRLDVIAAHVLKQNAGKLVLGSLADLIDLAIEILDVPHGHTSGLIQNVAALVRSE